ncbi:MAG TPA: virulence-associated E family protein [Paraburkholderia sp.]|uniref:virulence-associated E family protein n=1 Tax=Paraburkholderia sp. TaxID=1926495 RepID=UPI002ECFDFB6
MAVIQSERQWSREGDSTRLQEYIERQYQLTTTTEAISKVVHAHAEMHRVHPLRDWLDSLEWDGEKRIDTWLTRYCGAADTPFNREVGRRFLLSAVARIQQPGCKADHMLVLEGPQGIGKSRTIRTLAGDDYYSDATPDLDDARQTGETVNGIWMLEASEITGLRKHEADAVKAFLSRCEDTYRPAYGRESLVVSRQFVVAGTCNLDTEGTYLRDATGGRRFWPVRVTACDIDALTQDRAQLWAEAVAAYHRGDAWWIDDPEMLAQAVCEVEARTIQNPWKLRVMAYADISVH